MEYLKLVRRRALQETKKLWTAQRLWVAVASPIVTVPVRGFFSGWTARDLGLTAAVTVVVVAALWGMRFLFDLFRAPGILHRERSTEAEAKLQRVEEENQSALSTMSDQLRAEREQNQRPDINGEVSNFRCFTQEGTEFGVSCDLFLCNVRPVRAGVRRIAIDAGEVHPLCVFSISHLSPLVLERGIGQICELGMIVVLERDVDPRNAEVDLTPLKVYAIDDFGNRHALTVRRDTTLILEPPPDPRSLPDSD